MLANNILSWGGVSGERQCHDISMPAPKCLRIKEIFLIKVS